MTPEIVSPKEIYIDPVVLSDGADSPEMKDHPPDWRKQYEIWSHGNSIISSPSPSQQDLASAIVQLQRAVEFRDKLLNRLYAFENIPNRAKRNKYEVMADLGIIRPALKTHLRELRNSLMHETEEAPFGRQECERLSDIAWYYLKATDRLAQQCVEELGVHYWVEKEHNNHLSIVFNRSTWDAAIKGEIYPELRLEKQSPNCLSVRLDWAEVVRYRQSLKFRGVITGSPVFVDQLIQLFFEQSLF
jgi:hypothetical protein